MFSAGPRERQPPQLLELYSMEWCPACRRVRRTLTELDLDYVHRSCPVGNIRNRSFVERTGGRQRFPFLIDPNTGARMYESRAIVTYLRDTYGLPAPPLPLGAPREKAYLAK